MYCRMTKSLYSKDVRDVAARMLEEEELDGGWLEVCKVANNGGYIRVPVPVNAEWYRRFCRKYLRSRRRYPKPRTIIRRAGVRAALQRIIDGRQGHINVHRLLEHIEHDRKWYT
jgi:hypothetical protein